MSTQRVYQLLISVCVLAVIAFVSERSRVLAAILTVIPFNVTFGMWFIFTSTHGDPVLAADFARMVLFGLIPTSLFVLVCWFGLRQGWPLGRVLLVGYSVWLVTMILYRVVEAQVSHG